MSETLEATARRIADQGRDALLARLRPAFTQAASAHSDVLGLDEDQLEEMVQRAADRADGLQWRRALAGIATEELNIGLGEALSHPAVVRAQALVGAPSYEEGLAGLALAAAPAGPARGPGIEDEHESGDQADAEAAARAEEEEEEEEELDAPEAQAEAAVDPATAPMAVPTEAETVRLAAVHLGGIANLEPSEKGIELLLSDDGLDIARGSDELLGRLRWPEIRALDVPPPRGLLKRRRGGAHLVIRTRHGDATFEIPEASSDELRTQLEPLVQRHVEA